MQNAHDNDALIDEAEAADFLGLSIKTLQKRRVVGGGPQYVKISARCVRYRRRDLIAWSEGLLRTSTAA